MHIRCTNCGADVPLGAESTEVVCNYCESLLFVGKQAGIPHLVMSEYVTRADAALRIGRFLSKLEITDTPRLLDRQMIYLPYWQLNMKSRRTPAKWIAASAAPLDALLTIAPDSGDTQKRKCDDIPDHLLVDPDLLLEDAMRTIEFKPGDLAEEKPAMLIHVPFEKIQYQAVGETLTAYVDLVSGNVYADTTPASPQRHKSAVLGLVSLFSLVATIALVVVMPWPLVWVVVPLLLGILYFAIMKLLAWMAW